MSFKITLGNSFKIILKSYLLALLVFSIFRFILFLTELDRVNFQEVSFGTILQAFIMGIRFDLTISGYILFLPSLILFILDFFKLKVKWLNLGLFYFIFILFTVSFIISAADIPYFNQFYDRFSIGAFEWIENTSFVFNMIIQEPKYFLISIPCILLSIFFFRLLKKPFKNFSVGNYKNITINVLVAILCLGLIFLGIRGRIAKKSPIRVGTAYFSNHSFLNKLGLNPVFTLMRSYLDSQDSSNDEVKLMDNQLAIEKVRKYYHISNQDFNSPIARKVKFDSLESSKDNVIVILMESMSVAKLGRSNRGKNLTPFLDSLSQKALYFSNFYTAGKHTFNGIFSTLFSFPALYRQHPMKQIKEYSGIGTTLRENGYSTTYFTTHDSQFDNVEGFLRANDYEYIISQKDYPASEVKTTLGVPDDFMFRYSIPKLNELSNQGKPFFVSFMTASDHGPYYLPEYFTPKSEDIKDQIVEYADWSLKQFMEMASKQAWYNETIFVLLADHGAPIRSTYDISLDYFHSPLIIFKPEDTSLQSGENNKIASQIDVFPTIMSMLKIPFVNNTLGIDLLSKERKYTLINDDDKIGILDTSYFCVMKDKGELLQLYKYKKSDRKDYYEENPEKANEMADYAKALMQTHQAMIKEDQTKLEP